MKLWMVRGPQKDRAGEQKHPKYTSLAHTQIQQTYARLNKQGPYHKYRAQPKQKTRTQLRARYNSRNTHTHPGPVGVHKRQSERLVAKTCFITFLFSL